MKPLVEEHILRNLTNDVKKIDNNGNVFYLKEEDLVTFETYNLFDSCYKLNTNEIPARYYILPSKQIFKEYKRFVSLF